MLSRLEESARHTTIPTRHFTQSRTGLARSGTDVAPAATANAAVAPHSAAAAAAVGDAEAVDAAVAPDARWQSRRQSKANAKELCLRSMKVNLKAAAESTLHRHARAA